MLSDSISFKSTKAPLWILFTSLAETGGRADDKTKGRGSFLLPADIMGSDVTGVDSKDQVDWADWHSAGWGEYTYWE